MCNALLSFLLALQLAAGTPPMMFAAPASLPAAETVQEARLWWGLIDPEMSLWCVQLPQQEKHPEAPVLWDWSWRGFLAALFGIPAEKEAVPDASLA